jgi:hypothetical protein
MSKKNPVDTEHLGGRISREAFTIFRRAQDELNIPTGKLLEFMILDFEAVGWWGKLKDRDEACRAEGVERRLAADRKRKRDEKA